MQMNTDTPPHTIEVSEITWERIQVLKRTMIETTGQLINDDWAVRMSVFFLLLCNSTPPHTWLQNMRGIVAEVQLTIGEFSNRSNGQGE